MTLELVIHFSTYKILVLSIKFVETIKMEFVAPMPEQIATITMEFFKAYVLPHSLWVGSQFVLAWVQRISNFGSLDYRPILKVLPNHKKIAHLVLVNLLSWVW